MSVLTTTIRMEDSAFFASLNRMEGRLSGLATGFGALAGRMATAFVPVAAGIGTVTAAMFGLKKSVTEAANMEQLQTSFSVLIGSADVAKQTLADLQKFADETTFQMPEVAGAAKQMIAFGVGAKDVVGTIRMLGDVAAGLNIPLSELTDVYGRNLVQGRLFSRDIYQFQSRGIPIIAALAKQFGVAESEIMGMVEAGKVGSTEMVKAFEDLTGKGGQFAGMLAKQSKTFNGMMSTLADNIGAVFRRFGEPLLVVLKPVVDRLIQGVKDMAPAAQRFGETVARIISGLQGAFKSGKFTELVGLSLELGFAKAMNALAGGLETTLAIAGAAFSQLFGNADFWDGFTKAMIGVAGQFGAALLRAFEKPLAYVQAWFEDLAPGGDLSRRRDADKLASEQLRANDPRFKGLSEGDINGPFGSVGMRLAGNTEGLARQSAFLQAKDELAAKLAKEMGVTSLEEKASAILSNGGVRFGFGGEALNAGGIAQNGQDMVREGLDLLKKPAIDFLASAKLLAAAYQPAALYDEAKLNAIKERLKNLFPELPKDGEAGDAANARKGKKPGEITGGDYAIVADSLAKIGGGGGFAGVNAVLAEARETNAELRTVNKTLVELKHVMSGRIGGNEVSVSIIR